jgi:hypothetical protein
MSDDGSNRHEYNTKNTGDAQASNGADQIKEFGGVDLLDAGLRAAQRGWKIFPCNNRKKPFTDHGFHDATTDEQQIRSWAKQYPGCLWGYAIPKGVILIDLDLKRGKNGFARFEELQGCKPEQFDAPRVATATGGMHLYMDATGRDFMNSESKIATGVDTRAFGSGYAIIPSGPQAGYRWLSDPDTPLPPAPSWVDITQRQTPNFETMVNGQPYQGASPFGNFMLERACDAIRTAPDGKQETTLNGQSYLMGRYIGGGLLEREPTINALILVGLKMFDYDDKDEWTEAEIEKKVKKAVGAGMLKPDDDGTELDGRTAEINERVYNDPQLEQAVKDLLENGETIQVELPPPSQEPPPKQEPRQEPPKQRSIQQRFPDVLDAGNDLELPPPRAWLLGNVFCREFLSSLFGDGGIGKTALRYAQYLSLATGKSLTGEHVFQRCRVLIVSLEDNVVELRRRIWALRIKYSIKPEELKGWLKLWAPQATDGKLMTLNRFGNTVEAELADSIRALIKHYNIDLVGIDPFIKSHGVGENNNNAIDMVVQVLTNMCAEFHIAIDVPHHVSKPKLGANNEPGDANRGRGASAMKDAARLVYTLNAMTADEAKTFGINEHERWAYVRMDKGKVNIVPPARQTTWFKLVGVPIGNVNEIYKHGDEVQVVERWTPPDVMVDMTNEQEREILSRIEKGLSDGSRYTDVRSAKKRAAWKAVVDVVPTVNEQQAREIIKVWVRTKVLVCKRYRNLEARKDEEGLWKGVADDVPF